jgi:hypothetical protein
MSTIKKKSLISLKIAILFGLVTLPIVYKSIKTITNINTYDIQKNCPTNSGLLIVTILFFILTFLSMLFSPLSNGLKLKYSIYSSLIFFFLSSPVLYSQVASIFGNSIANVNGCPTIFGILLHSFVYFILLIAVMYLPPDLK